MRVTDATLIRMASLYRLINKHEERDNVQVTISVDELRDLIADLRECREALQAIVDYVDKDREKFARSFVLHGPRAALPLYNLARAALAPAGSKETSNG